MEWTVKWSGVECWIGWSLVAGAFLGIVLASLACCWCCKCGCFSYRKNPGVPVGTILAPGQQLQMGPVGGAYGQPQQAYGYPQVRTRADTPELRMTTIPPSYDATELSDEDDSVDTFTL